MQQTFDIYYDYNNCKTKKVNKKKRMEITISIAERFTLAGSYPETFSPTVLLHGHPNAWRKKLSLDVRDRALFPPRSRNL